MELLLLIPLIISFLTTLIILPKWIRKARGAKLVWPDMNKYAKPSVSGSGGIVVITALTFGILTYIAFNTFYSNSTEHTIRIFALTTSLLILAIIGLIDDLLGWRHGGLGRRLRMFLCLYAAIPLMVINAGVSRITLPFLGSVEIGILYVLLAVPIGIVATATTFNFLAGFNGLESGQGIILFSSLALVTYLTGSTWLAFISLLVVASLIPFWFYNKTPAKVLPGDILTYPLGGLIAIIAILGNVEKIALVFFIPYIIELILKARGGLIKQSFGKADKNNNLSLKYDKIYGLEHLAIYILSKFKKEVKEGDVVWLIHSFQLLFVIIGFLVMRRDLII